MDSNNLQFLREEKLSKQPIKSSNFSIDHILNIAGSDNHNSSVKNKNPLDVSMTLLNQKTNFVLDTHNHSHYTPILDWLQYTRYRPPRLPRPARIGPIKRTPGRLPRIPFTPYQLNELEAAYKHANYLSSEDASKLAMHLDLTCTRVKIWFQNRRARERRENRQIDLKPTPLPPSSLSPTNFAKSLKDTKSI